MLQSLTVALERNTLISGPFATEPYEVAWAREARFYLRPLQFEGDFGMEFRTETSSDGIHWGLLDDTVHTLGSDELLTWPVREFGGWLRIRGNPVGSESASMKVLISLSLKS